MKGFQCHAHQDYWRRFDQPSGSHLCQYRLFAALSQVLDTGRVQNASLVLRRAKSTRHCDGVVCTVTVELNGRRSHATQNVGDHPYAAINRAVDRFRLNWRPERLEPLHREMVATE